MHRLNDEGLVERLREEARRLSGHSLDRGSVDAGIASNVADEAADELEARATLITELHAEVAKTKMHLSAWEDSARINKARADEVEAAVAKLTKERDERPKFIRCGRDLTVNRNEVASVEWDRRMYMNGSSSWLVITMNDGRQHRIESTYGHYDSVDCSKIEKEIIGA